MQHTHCHPGPMKQRSAALDTFLAFTAEHREVIRAAAMREFDTRPSDVFVATFPKCGTTWMQHIVHGLRTHGDMNFGEISQVVPFFEMEVDFEAFDAPQPAEPRAFKTHLSWDLMPKGGATSWC